MSRDLQLLLCLYALVIFMLLAGLADTEVVAGLSLLGALSVGYANQRRP